MNGCDFPTDAGNLDREGEVEAGAPIDYGIGIPKADIFFKNEKSEAHGGPSSGEKFSEHIRITENRQGFLAECATQKEANVSDAAEYEFRPTTAQHLELLTIVGTAGERLSEFGSDDADADHELTTTVPPGDEDAGSDQALDK